MGVSTRGCDSGDGRLHVNTADSARLGHDYTVFAKVVLAVRAVRGG